MTFSTSNVLQKVGSITTFLCLIYSSDKLIKWKWPIFIPLRTRQTDAQDILKKTHTHRVLLSKPYRTILNFCGHLCVIMNTNFFLKRRLGSQYLWPSLVGWLLASFQGLEEPFKSSNVNKCIQNIFNRPAWTSWRPCPYFTWKLFNSLFITCIPSLFLLLFHLLYCVSLFQTINNLTSSPDCVLTLVKPTISFSIN